MRKTASGGPEVEGVECRSTCSRCWYFSLRSSRRFLASALLAARSTTRPWSAPFSACAVVQMSTGQFSSAIPTGQRSTRAPEVVQGHAMHGSPEGF